MRYQIRHKEYGVFQGEFFGLGFWHPLSNTPEYGYCEFITEMAARKFINYLCSGTRVHPLKEDDLFIEPFNEKENKELGELAQKTLKESSDKDIKDYLKQRQN